MPLGSCELGPLGLQSEPFFLSDAETHVIQFSMGPNFHSHLNLHVAQPLSNKTPVCDPKQHSNSSILFLEAFPELSIDRDSLQQFAPSLGFDSPPL